MTTPRERSPSPRRSTALGLASTIDGALVGEGNLGEQARHVFTTGVRVFGEEFTAGTSTLLGVQSLFVPGRLLEIAAIAILD